MHEHRGLSPPGKRPIASEILVISVPAMELSSSSAVRSPGVLLHRLSGPLTALLRCGIAQHATGGVIELMVDDHEAAQGGMVYISMPVSVRCPICGGSPAATSCFRCDESGTIEEPFSAWLSVLPGVTDGTVLAPSAQLPRALRAVSFRVRRREL